METALNIKPFPCPIHKNDNIERVSLDTEQPSPLFCIECILHSQASQPQSSIVTLSSLLQKLCDHYKTNKSPRHIAESAPNEFVEFLSQEKEVIDVFSRHIESEKVKVTEVIEQALEITKELLIRKRDQLHQTLDVQLLNLKANYAYYKGKIEYLFGSSAMEEELQNNQEGLVKKINSLQSTQDLEVFVRVALEDIETPPTIENRQWIINKLQAFSERLIQQSKNLPKWPVAEEILETFRGQVDLCIQNSFSNCSDFISKLVLRNCFSSKPQGSGFMRKEDQDKQRVLGELVTLVNTKASLEHIENTLKKNNVRFESLMEMSNTSPKDLENFILVLLELVQVPNGLKIPGILSNTTMKVLVQALDSGNEKVVLKALDCLYKILEFGEQEMDENVNIYLKLLEEAGGIQKIENLQNHTSDEVYKRVSDLIDKFLCGDDY